MYGRAMKCDQCGKIEMINPSLDVYSVDGATYGWIILNINQPLEDNYTFRPPRRSDVTAVVDVCTIQCANLYLRNCLPDAVEAQQ
jgi:hypothetical protein